MLLKLFQMSVGRWSLAGVVVLCVFLGTASANESTRSGRRETERKATENKQRREGAAPNQVRRPEAKAAAPEGASAKSRNKPPPPLAEAQGRPHTIVERSGRSGQYTTYNGNGTWKQYRGSGKEHGGIPRPNVKETKINTAPNGKAFVGNPTVRPAQPHEIPGGK